MQNSCHCRLKDESKDMCNTIEFKDGLPQSYIKLKSNSIRTGRYTLMNFIPVLLWMFGRRITNLYIMFCVIIAASFPKWAPYTTSIYLFPFVISFVVYCLKEIYIERKYVKDDQRVNSLDTKVCKDDIDSTTWGELSVGDVVYLRQGDTVPADIVLLDSQQLKHRSAITYVTTQAITGCSKALLKKSAYLTQLQYRGIQKNNWSHYRQILSGKLTYENSSKDDGQFQAYLKLVRDPKVEQLTIENLIPRGSVIKTSLWVFGMVVYAGEDTKIMQMRQSTTSNKRPNFFSSLSQKMTIFCIVSNTILALLFVIVHINSPDVNLLQKVVYYFLLFSALCSTMVYPFLDVLSLFTANKLEKSLKVKINNPYALQELGCVDYVIMNKMGVISTGEYLINEIMTPSCMYKVNDSSMLERKPRKSKRTGYRTVQQHNSNFMSLALTEKPLAAARQVSCTDSEKFEIDDNNMDQLPGDMASRVNKHYDYQLEPLVLDRVKLMKNVICKQKEAYDSALAMALCHEAKFHYNHKQQEFRGISHDSIQELLLGFCRTVGISFECYTDLSKENLINIVNDDGEKKQYEILGTGQFQFVRPRFSIVCRQGEKASIVCKGTAESMLKIIKFKEDQKAKIENKLAQYKLEGIQPIIYARKTLSNSEIASYSSEYMSVRLSLTTTARQIDEFTSKYEKDLEFVCMIGINDELAICHKQLVTHLTKCGIKYGIMTSDAADSTINVGKKLIAHSFSDKIDYIHLDIGSKEQIKYQISETLTLMKNKQSFSYVIVLNQRTADMVLRDHDAQQHFVYLLYKCKSFIGYELQPETIGRFATMLKENSPVTATIMALGYGYHSLQLTSRADVSIGFGEVPADINAEQLSQVILLMKRGPSNFTTSLRLANEILYRLVLIGCVLTIYECVTFNYMSRVIEAEIVWLSVNIFLTLGVLIKILFIVRKNDWEVSEDWDKNYSTNSVIKKNIFRNYMMHTFLEGTIHGVVIVLTTYFVLPKCKFNVGYLYNNHTENIIILIQVVFTPIFRMLLFCEQFQKWGYSTGTVLTNIFTYIICMAIVGYVQGQPIVPQFYSILLSYDCAILTINTLIFNIALSYIIKVVLTQRLLNLLNPGNHQKALHEQFRADQNKQLIQRLFSSVENINPNILEIMNDDNINYNSIKFNQLLEFKHEPLNHKFDFQQQNQKYTKECHICITMCVCVLAQVVCSVQESQWTFKSSQNIYYLCAFGQIVLITVSKLLLPLKHFSSRVMGIWIVVLCASIIAQHYVQPLRHYITWLCVLSLFSSKIMGLKLLDLIALTTVLCITTAIAIYTYNPEMISSFLLIVFTFTIFLTNLEQYRAQMIEKKSKFLNEETFRNETDHAEDILSLLVPRFVHKYIKEGEYNMQQAQNDVSILFCYVCNFDTIVKEQGKNVVHLMDELFRQFDQLCHNYATQKIETVGMTYMAATGITAWQDEFDNSYTRKNSVERLLHMAIAMIEKSKGIMYGKNKDKRLTIKIGIHTGKVVIGVIGYHKPQFSLIGDTVNTTSRHCSTAKEGEIILSDEAVKKLKYKSSLFEKKKAQMKGLGVVDVHKWKTDELNVDNNYEEKNKRFRKAVKDVIEQLKQENKIVYKSIAERMKTAFQIKNTRARRSRMTSVHSIQEKVLELAIDMIEEDRHSNDSVTEVVAVDYSMISAYKAKKYTSRGQLLLTIQIIVLIIETPYELWLIGVYELHLALRVVSILLLAGSIYKYADAFKNTWWRVGLLAVQFIFILSINSEMFYISKPDYTNQLLMVMKMLLLTLSSGLHLFTMKELVVLMVIGYVMPISFALGFFPMTEFSHDLSCFVFYCAMLLLRKHRSEDLIKEIYKSISIQDKQKKEQQALVSQLLPKHAFLKLRNQNLSNKIQLTDQIQGATLLFADIKGFTSYSNKNSPQQVVNMLRKLFEQFDKTCLKFNVYKVYTIGDCYVVLGFTNPFQRDIAQQAKNVVSMGLAMVDIVHNVRQQIDFQQLDMRIGIHTGTIIGGIIGTDIVRYDIYGRDVMIANKFEQYGTTGAVHISASTKAILDNNKNTNFKIVPNGTVKVQKLNVQIPGYIVSRKKFE